MQKVSINIDIIPVKGETLSFCDLLDRLATFAQSVVAYTVISGLRNSSQFRLSFGITGGLLVAPPLAVILRIVRDVVEGFQGFDS